MFTEHEKFDSKYWNLEIINQKVLFMRGYSVITYFTIPELEINKYE